MATRIVEHIVAERLGQITAVSLVYIAQRRVVTYDLIYSDIEPLVNIVSRNQGLYLDCIFDVIRHGWVNV